MCTFRAINNLRLFLRRLEVDAEHHDTSGPAGQGGRRRPRVDRDRPPPQPQVDLRQQRRLKGGGHRGIQGQPRVGYPQADSGEKLRVF